MNLKNNPELVPLIEWWEKDGKSTVLWLLVAAVAVGGFYGWKNHRLAKKAAASDVLTTAFTTEEIEDAVNKYSGMDAAVALKIRLAKSYFDAENYELAMATYDELAAQAPAAFADIPVVGKAQCLEAKGDFAAALAAFDDFVEKNPTNYLRLTAQLGGVRCLAQQEKKDEALKRVSTLKDEYKDDEASTARIDATEKLVKRYEKKAPEAPVAAPVAAPAEEKKAEEKPAEAK